MTQALYHIEGDTKVSIRFPPSSSSIDDGGTRGGGSPPTSKGTEYHGSLEHFGIFSDHQSILQDPAEITIGSDAQLVHIVSQRRGRAAGHEKEESAQIEGLMQQLFGPERWPPPKKS